eukprot:8648424-Pyramimonas_sp.AAC.1
MGGAYAGQVADRPTTMYFDYLGVGRVAEKTREQQCADRYVYACAQVFGNNPPGRQYVQEAEHVKPHRSGSEYEQLTHERRRLTDGNIAAGGFAKRA